MKKIYTKTFSIIMILVMVITAAPLTEMTIKVNAESIPEGYTEISSVDDLNNIRNNLDGNYFFTADIDLTEAAINWSPIGNDTTPFTGKECGNSFVDSYVEPSHTWSGWTIGNGSSNTEKIRCCTVCGETETAALNTGDVIEFGSYPQSKVSDNNILTALDSLDKEWVSYDYYIGTGTEFDGKMKSSDYMKYCDIGYGGNKYRAVTFSSYRPYRTDFASSAENSSQDNNGYTTGNVYYFKYEPLTWRVLDPNEGFVVSNVIIDSQAYNNYIIKSGDYYYGDSKKTYYANDYEHSSIRAWLNNDFYNIAFTDAEKKSIKKTELDNKAFSSEYSQFDSNKTNDKVFLLECSNIKEKYGFNINDLYDEYACLEATDYSLCQGLLTATSSGYREHNWHLRSAGSNSGIHVHFHTNVPGYPTYYTPLNSNNLGDKKADTSETRYGVVPAIKICGEHECVLTEKIIKEPNCTQDGKKTMICAICAEEYPEEVISALGHDMKNGMCTRCGLVISSYKAGDIITFGSYPQSKVTDEETISALDDIEKTWVSYGYYIGTGSEYDGNMAQSDYMKYCDISYNNEKYRAVYFTAYRPKRTGYTSSLENSDQDENGYYINTVYYFKYEPLKWRILDPDEGFVVSNIIIDSQAYNNYIIQIGGDYYGDSKKTYYANNYEHSSIRAWLNNDFYNIAFSDFEKEAIKITELDNKAFSPTYSQYDSNKTNDKIFLLSSSEIKSEYGYNKDNLLDEKSNLDASDYALCQGLASNNSNPENRKHNWSLRTAGQFSGKQAYFHVNIKGYPSYYLPFNDSTFGDSKASTESVRHGIVPAIKFNLNLIHHCEYEERIINNPTCLQDGKKVLTCSVCGDSYTESIPALGHDWNSDYTVDIEATCQTTGLKSIHCSRCDETKDEQVIPEIGHTVVIDARIEPTCTSAGLTEGSHCSNCSEVIQKQNFIPALGHSYTETVIPPTCVKGGYTLHTCEKCMDSYTDNQTEPTGHHYTDTIVAPTCQDRGFTVHTCPDCGDTYVDSYVDAAGHDYSDTVVPATCKEGGYTVHTCKTCGDEYTDSYTEATGCNYVDTVVPPTCKDRGYTIHTCADCGDTFIDSYTDTVPHKFTSVTINPTCTNEGYTLNTCDDCGFASITNKISPIGHDYIDMVVDPTCEKEGYTTHMCTRGDHYYIDNKVPALGHSYDKTVIQSTCIQDGCTLNICTKCGKVSKSDVIPASGHTFSNWMTVEYATEAHEGLQQRHCQNCGYCEDKIIPIVNRTTFNVTFKADGKIVAVVEYVKGSDTIEEPPVPHKDRFTGKWEEYSLNDSDITVNAVYTVINTDDLNGVDSGESARYDAETGVATINLYAASQGKTIVSTSSKAVPLDIILVVDQSGSMDDRLGSGISKKQALINSANAFVNSVYADASEYNVDHRVAIVGFGMGNTASGAAYPAYLNTEILTTGGNPVQMNKAKTADYANALMYVNNNGSLNTNITRAINNIDANGATAADFGLAMANNIYANNADESGERQRIVVFMTDGAPTYSSNFSKDVANAAILQANELKETYGANVYCVGVMSATEAKNTNISNFMNAVSSNYSEAKSVDKLGKNSSSAYYYNVTNTNALSGVFTKIVAENVTRTTDFDNVTMISTVSKYFTLTSQQEKELRLNAIKEYGVTNDDITVIGNDDGTTTVIIKGMHPVDDGSQFVIDFSYHVSANENAPTAGSYPVGTDDAGIMLGDAENYEATFNVPYVSVPTDRGTAVFTINGEIYTIKTVLDGKAPTAPATDFEGQYQFSGWTISANSMASGYAVYDATFASQEYVVIWNTAEGTQRVAYNPGDVITVPDVPENEQGDAFRRWNGIVPDIMPDHSIEFTAVYGDHEHIYDAETVKEMTCLEDGTVKYTCEICGDTYTETITCPGHHTWKAIAGPADKDNHSTAAFECENCGLCADNSLDYILTDNEANERGHYNSITHEFNYLDGNGTAHQPNGLITIISNINEYFGDADGVNVYRIDDNGNRIKCESEYDNGVLSFETNHFSTYVYEPVYECQTTGNHIDANDDGYCDRCDSVLEEFIDFILKSGIDAQIDRDYRILMGNDVLSYSSESVAGMFEFGNIFIEGKENGRIGTGDVICLTNSSGTVCSRLTAVIFGDVNGDGWYDSMDSIIVNCLANGLLSEAQVGEAKYMAADCNHDGVIDSADVALLEQAGIILASVDQTKSEAELMTDSAYVEYISLIDQSPAEEVISENITTSDEQTSDKEDISENTTAETLSAEKTTDSTADKSVNQSLVQKILSVIIYIFRMIIAYIPKAV